MLPSAHYTPPAPGPAWAGDSAPAAAAAAAGAAAPLQATHCSPYTPLAELLASPGTDEEEDLELAATLEQPAFAAADTLPTAAEHLEPVLRGLGLRQWQLRSGDPVAALNCLHELVRRHQELQDARGGLQDELHRAKGDIRAAGKTIDRLQTQSQAKEQEVGGLTIKLRQLDAWCREEADRWAQEREALARKCAQLEQRHTQWTHELRRRDAEFERLQKHLSGQLARRASAAASSSGGGSRTCGSSRTAGSRPGRIQAGSRSSSSAGGATDTRRMTKAELEELHKRATEAHDTERQALQEETASLRRALQSLEREHLEVLNTTRGSSRTSSIAAAAAGAHQQHPQPLPGSLQLADSRSNGPSAAPPPLPAAAAAPGADDPVVALQRMRGNLQALRVRKQRIIAAGPEPLAQLQQAAESASERLLLVKLQEAGRIMEEQEAALACALRAMDVGSGRGGGSNSAS